MNNMEIEYRLALDRALFERIKKIIFNKIRSKQQNEFGLPKFRNYAVYTYLTAALEDTNRKYRRVETFNSTYYEVKEKISSEIVQYVNISNSKIPLKINYATEKHIEKEEFNKSDLTILSNAERILRLSASTEFFTIDLSIRYIFNNDSRSSAESSLKENTVKTLKLDFNDFKSATIVSNCKILYDVEFELKSFVVKQIIDEKDGYRELMKKLQYQIIEFVTGNNQWVADMIQTYIRTPGVVSLSNDVISRSKEDDYISLLKTDGVRNLLILTIFKNEFRAFLRLYRWNSIDSELIDNIEITDNLSKFTNNLSKITKENDKSKGGSLEKESETLLGILDCERVSLSKTTSKKISGIHCISTSDLYKSIDSYDYYYIFDVYNSFKYNRITDVDHDCRELPYEDRMKEAVNMFKTFPKEIVSLGTISSKSHLGNVLLERKTMNGYNLRIVLKNYNSKISFADVIKTTQTIQKPIKDGLANIEFDGLILQLKCPYSIITKGEYRYFDLSKTYNFKVKPPRFNTIDFKLKNNNSKKMPRYPSGQLVNKETINPVYNLYLIGSCLESTYCLRELARVKTIEKNTEILFETPFYDNTHVYDASLDDPIFNRDDVIDDKDNVINDNDNEDIQITSKDALSKIHPKDIDLNNKIIEMYYDNDKKIWKIHRIREDKIYPNGYRIGFSNMSIHFDPLRLESYYADVSNLKTFPEDLVIDFHDCSHSVRNIIYNKLQEQMISKKFDDFTHINYLDIAGGRGADIEYIIKLMKVMKPNAILNLFATDISSTGLVKYALKTQKLAVQYQKEINLNVIAKPNGDDKQNEELYEEIISRHEYKKFNIINVSFGIHYISNYIPEFIKFCERLMADDCILMLTFYDSDAVLESINKFKVFKDIKINPEKNEAYMPLPTISSSGYREEPCMLKSHIETLKKSFESSFSIIDFNPFFNQKSKIRDNELYFNCVRTLIFTKNI